MWRVPCDEATASEIFISGYKNGAFIIPCSNEHKYLKLLHKLELHLNSDLKMNLIYDSICQIPCGQCLECKLSNSREWAQRSVAEASMHSENWFITLTYDDEHLPPSELTYSRHSFEFGAWHPLVYEDFQAFKKRFLERLRYLGIEDVRFLMCGEYGPKNGRPHFHAIFYNCPLPDLKKVKDVTVGGKSFVYLTSEIVEKSWGKGFITIGEVNWETSAYVSRYVMKKFSSLDEYDYQKLCFSNGWEPLPPEMRQASRRPGLAKPYFDEKKDEIYRLDKVVLPNGKTCKPCAYFDSLYDLENPELLQALKEIRKQRAFIRELNEQSDCKSKNINYKEYKDKQYDALVRRVNKLKRNL